MFNCYGLPNCCPVFFKYLYKPEAMAICPTLTKHPHPTSELYSFFIFSLFL